MKKRYLLGVLLCLLITTSYGKTYNVTIASLEDTDSTYINALNNAGYKVHNAGNYWHNITAAKVAEINSYDLVIIPRETNSINFGDDINGGDLNNLWKTVTVPVINMNSYINRSSRMQFFNTTSVTNSVASVMVAADTSHILFKNITLNEGDSTLDLATTYCGNPGVIDAGNGKVIARAPSTLADSSLQNIVTIAEWEANIPFYSELDASSAHQGKRMWFAGTSKSNAPTAEGKKLFLNAVEYMITGTVSDPGTNINLNKVEAEVFTAMSGVVLQETNDTNGGEHVTFTKRGSWAEYTIDVEADYYDLKFRVASPTGFDTLRVYADGEIIGHVIAKETGSTQIWQTEVIPVNFETAGTKNIRFEYQSSNDTLNLNWFDYQEEGLSESSLKFDSKGQVSEMMIDGFNVMGNSSSDRFTLYKYNGTAIEKSTSFTATTEGNRYILTAAGGLPKFTFRIDTYPRHFSLHLVDVEGVGNDRNYGLVLKLQFNKKMDFKTLSDLIYRSTKFSSDNSITIRWQFLYGKEGDGARGGIVFWDGSLSGYELDKTLAEVWSTEQQMPKPSEQPSWKSSDILNWVDNYASRYNNLTQVQLEPTSYEELYSMLENFVIPIGAKQVYLHCNVWREEYWLKTRSRVYVNTKMFPNGKDDLKVLADYLHERDMTLALHSLSYGIGRSDPNYVVGKVDRRLGSWGSGTLEGPINASQKRILFRPDSDVEIPLLGRHSHTGERLYYNYMRIGEEIVKVGNFSRTEKDVWVLSDCERGHRGTDPASHSADTDMGGLYCPYNQNYIPNFDMGEENSLSDELIKEYADFVNEIGLDHLHYDGPEIHLIHHDWCNRPMLSAAYNQVNRPTTTSRVGRNLAANFELEFSKIKDDKSYAYFPIELGLRLHAASSKLLATSFLGMHFHATECLMLGARRVNLTGVKNANGITQQALDDHGMADEVTRMFKYYKELAPILDDADLAYLSESLSKTSGSSHYESEDVNVLTKNSEGDYIYTPYHVLGYKSGATEPWYIHQELGAVPRIQIINTGSSMALANPKPASDLNCIIRVSDQSNSTTNPRIELSTGGYIEFTGTLKPNEYLDYKSDSTTATICNEDWKPIGTMAVSKSDFTAPKGSFTVTMKGTGTVELETQFYVIGEPYVLSTNSKLK